MALRREIARWLGRQSPALARGLRLYALSGLSGAKQARRHRTAVEQKRRKILQPHDIVDGQMCRCTGIYVLLYPTIGLAKPKMGWKMVASAHVPVMRVIGFTKRRKHPYRPENYMQISFLGIDELQERIADRSLGKQAIRVLLAMMASCDYSNKVQAGQKDLAKRLGMDQANVAKAINALIACGFVERSENYHARYVISPRLAWKGGEDTLRQALAERNMLDGEGYMRGAAA